MPKLKWTFSEPEQLRPGRPLRHLTGIAVEQFAEPAKELRAEAPPPADRGAVRDRWLFRTFAEDIGRLPSRMFKRMLEETRRDPAELVPLCF